MDAKNWGSAGVKTLGPAYVSTLVLHIPNERLARFGSH